MKFAVGICVCVKVGRTAIGQSQTDQSQTENFSKEALNIAVLIFGITFRLKLSKLNQFIYLKVVLSKICDINNRVYRFS